MGKDESKNVAPETGHSHLPLLLTRLAGFAFFTFFWLSSMVLLALFLFNLPQIYGFEVVALDTIIGGIYPGTTITAAAILAAIPWVAICVIATIVTVGVTTLTIYGKDPLGWLDREIETLKRMCPLSAPGQPTMIAWLDCRSRLSGMRTAYWGIWLCMGVTTVNIVVLIERFTGPLPLPPRPPVLPF
jgi:uncharacterized membrane protein